MAFIVTALATISLRHSRGTILFDFVWLRSHNVHGYNWTMRSLS